MPHGMKKTIKRTFLIPPYSLYFIYLQKISNDFHQIDNKASNTMTPFKQALNNSLISTITPPPICI
jgi:hypothetical protein